jgi:hypothetical protein
MGNRKMKIPKIKINIDSGEADIVNWEEFDKMNSLWRYDVLGDLKGIIDFQYEQARADYKIYLEDLIKKVKKEKAKK